MLKEIKISRIVPARSWYYMYAYTDGGNYFIYSHRDRVSFFATNEAEDISNFQDTVTKLTTFKYFNEKSENCVRNLAKVEFDKKIENTIKFGTCLVTDDIQTNYKADVYVDNYNHAVILKLYSADEFSKELTSDIELPDQKEKDRVKNKKEIFQNAKDNFNPELINLIYEQPEFFQKIISFGFAFKIDELDKYSNILDWTEVSKNLNIHWTSDSIRQFKEMINWQEFSKHIKFNRELIDSHLGEIDWEDFSHNKTTDWHLILPFYENKLNWKNLSGNSSFPWTKENILRYQSKIDWYSLCRNEAAEFDIDLLRQFHDKIDWNIIATNTGDWWTKEIIDEFKDRLRWRNLLVYGVFWTADLIEYFESYIKKDYGFSELSHNPEVAWTEELLDKYREELGWGWLAENPGLPWSMELIEKYKDEWNWSHLGTVIWDVEFADKHVDEFTTMNGSSSLWTNKIVIKNEDFCIKHKDILFPKNKGGGLMRIMDASGNTSLPVSVSFFYKLKDNLDWNVNLLKMVKETGKYENLISEISFDILDLLLETEHFTK
jgi:hypothetical protein